MAEQIGEADGSIVIAARIDETEIRASLERLEGALQRFKQNTSSEIRSIPKEAERVRDTLKSSGRVLAAGLSAGLISGRTELSAAVRGVLTGAIRSAFSLRPAFESVGSSMIGGMIAGIRNAAQGLWNTLTGVAAGLVGTLQTALGIASPSRVMRDRIGRNIGLGLRDGILAEQEAVFAAASKLSDSVISGAQEAAGVSLQKTYGAMVRATAEPGALMSENRNYGVGGRSGQSAGSGAGGKLSAQNTFVFNQPVETPYAHARAIRQTMEALLYGI